MADLVDILTEHQWEFDSRYFCVCGAPIRYDLPYSADRAMASHQIDEAKQALPDLRC